MGTGRGMRRSKLSSGNGIPRIERVSVIGCPRDPKREAANLGESIKGLVAQMP